MARPHPRTVGLFIVDDVEVRDVCGPCAVISVARPVGEQREEAPLFTVVTKAPEPRLLTGRGGDTTLDDEESFVLFLNCSP